MYDENNGSFDSYLSEEDEPQFILYSYRWVNLVVYFLGLTTSGFNMVMFSSVAKQVAKGYGFYDPSKVSPKGVVPHMDGIDTAYIDMIPVIFLIMYVPFNFVVIKSLEKGGLRVTVSKIFLTINS